MIFIFYGSRVYRKSVRIISYLYLFHLISIVMVQCCRLYSTSFTTLQPNNYAEIYQEATFPTFFFRISYFLGFSI